MKRVKSLVFKRLAQISCHSQATHLGNAGFNIFSALAQFERRLIQERTKAGLAAARSRGRNGGRPKLSADEAKVLLSKKLHKDQTLEIDDICKTLRISRSTFYRYVRM